MGANDHGRALRPAGGDPQRLIGVEGPTGLDIVQSVRPRLQIHVGIEQTRRVQIQAQTGWLWTAFKQPNPVPAQSESDHEAVDGQAVSVLGDEQRIRVQETAGEDAAGSNFLDGK